MNRKITADKLKDWMVKNWLLVALGGLWILLIVAFGMQGLRKFNLSTPIAKIDPEDSLNVANSLSKLESYRNEMEEMKSEHFRKRLAMEKIVAMDFGAMRIIGKEEGDAEGLPYSGSENKASQLMVSTEEMNASKSKYKRKKVRKSPVRADVGQKEKNDSAWAPFYTIKAEGSTYQETNQQAAPLTQFFRAVIDGDQKVFSNSTVSLRLLEEMKVGGQVFPRHTLVHGRLSGGSGGRLKISISNINGIPVKMLVYDQDYHEGIAYARDEPLSSSLEESRDHALDQILFSVPFGDVFNGVAQAGRKMLQKNSRSKPLFLADGYPLFIGFERGNYNQGKQ